MPIRVVAIDAVNNIARSPGLAAAAVSAIEKIGVDAASIKVEAKAMGLLQSVTTAGGWETEATKRAQEGAERVHATLKE